MQNKDRMLRSFAKTGYVPFVEELLSMGADPASKVAPLCRTREGRELAMESSNRDSDRWR